MTTPVLYSEKSYFYEHFIWIRIKRPENKETANRLLKRAHSMSDFYENTLCVVLLISNAEYPNIVKLSFKRLA